MASTLTPFLTVFTGDDTISREREKHELVSRIVKKSGSIDESQFDSDTDTVGSFCERVMTPSLFATVRVFYMRHANRIAADDATVLNALLRTDIPDVHIIMECDETGGKGGKRKGGGFDGWLAKLATAAKKNPDHFLIRSLEKPPEYKVAEWLVENAPGLFNRRISKADADYFVDLVGFDFDTINSELQKIDIFLPQGSAITRAVIAEVIEGSRSMSAFELAQALGRRDLPRALEIIDSLFSASFYAPPVVGAVFRHFWALYRIRSYGAANPNNIKQFQNAVRSYNKGVQNTLGVEIGVAAGLLTPQQSGRVFPAIIKSGVVDQALAFSPAALGSIIRLLQRYDVAIKTGKTDGSKRGFELLCYKIARAPQLGNAVLES